MGTPEVSAVPTRDQQIQTMKVFILLCVVVAAMAEADPYLVYSGYGGLHHGYAGYGYGGYSAYPYSTFHYGKREAEAEPKAEADAYHHLYSGYGYGAIRPAVYGGVYGYGGYPYASTFHYGKREAEADAKPYYYSGLHYGKREAEAEPYYYGGYYGGYRAYRPYSYG